MLSSSEKYTLKRLSSERFTHIQNLALELNLRERATPKQEVEIFGYATRKETPSDKEPQECDLPHPLEYCRICRLEWGRHRGHICRGGESRGIFSGCEGVHHDY